MEVVVLSVLMCLMASFAVVAFTEQFRGARPFIDPDGYRADEFLLWVWRNRRRLELVDGNSGLFRFPTPTKDGEWMLLQIDGYGVELFLSETEDSVEDAESVAMFSPEWEGVQDWSLRLWEKLWDWRQDKTGEVDDND